MSRDTKLIEKLEAAQLLWYAAHSLYNQGVKDAVDWFEVKGVEEVRRCCRGVYVIEAFWEARDFVDEYTSQSLWQDKEEFAEIFLLKCLSRTMHVSRDWKIYLTKAIEEATK